MVIQIHYGDFEVYLKVHRGAIYLTIFFNFLQLFYLTFFGFVDLECCGCGAYSLNLKFIMFKLMKQNTLTNICWN